MRVLSLHPTVLLPVKHAIPQSNTSGFNSFENKNYKKITIKKLLDKGKFLNIFKKT